MDKWCFSCGAPLTPEFKGSSEEYCKFCTDETGKLKSFEEIKFGVAEWLKSWQPNLEQDKAVTRAGFYLKAMPAWAE